MNIVSPTPDTFAVKDAWKPLPMGFWEMETAQHFLRRVGFSATPEAVTSVLRNSPGAYIETAFKPGAILPRSKDLKKFTDEAHTRYQKMYKVKDAEEKRELRRNLQREENELFRSFAMDWFHYAREPENSAREKLVMFLQDIFVVEQQKIKDPEQLHAMQQMLRDGTARRFASQHRFLQRY